MPLSQLSAESRIHGRDALEAVGMPLEFAAQVMLLASELGIAIAIRAGKPFQLYMDLCAPKPPYVKAKTGNWGFTKGVIPDEACLSKIDANRYLIQSPEKPAEVSSLHHKIKLSEVILGLNAEPPEYILQSLDKNLSPEDYVKQTGQLVVKCTAENSPINHTILFCLDLSQHTAPQVLNDNSIRTNLHHNPIIQPSWWQDKWGKFATVTADRYPTYFLDCNRNLLQPIYVYAIQREKKLVPITGDMDLLWISKPSSARDTIFPHRAHKVLNTSILEDTAKMLEALIELHQYFAEQKNEKFDVSEIRDESIGREGCITPFESFFITLINERFAEFAPHITNLFQHGAENRNPGIPSNIDGRILHIWDGQVYLTENELDLIDFVLTTPGYLEKNKIDIHPKWNPKLWAPVIEKQDELEHRFLLKKIFNELKTSNPVHVIHDFVDRVKENFLPDYLLSHTYQFALIRSKPVGSYIETKRFTSRETLLKLEALSLSQGWVLDKLSKQISFQKNQINYVFKLAADAIYTNFFDTTMIVTLVQLAKMFEVSPSEILARSSVKGHEEKFYQAYEHLCQKPTNTLLDQDLQKIDDIIKVSTLVKRFNPLAYTQFFKGPRKRKLSFNADAKAQRAWINFFNQKSSGMTEDERVKFIRAHQKIHEIIDDFPEIGGNQLRSG